MSTPESSFITSVHDALHASVHREKMANPYRSGTADVWYSAQPFDLWIEYKFVPMPKRFTTMIDLADLFSPLQLRWLASRHREGRRVFACVGTKLAGHYCGIVLEHPAWLDRLSASQLANAAQRTGRIAQWIYAVASNQRKPFEPVYDLSHLKGAQ